MPLARALAYITSHQAPDLAVSQEALGVLNQRKHPATGGLRKVACQFDKLLTVIRWHARQKPDKAARGFTQQSVLCLHIVSQCVPEAISKLGALFGRRFSTHSTVVCRRCVLDMERDTDELEARVLGDFAIFDRAEMQWPGWVPYEIARVTGDFGAHILFRLAHD